MNLVMSTVEPSDPLLSVAEALARLLASLTQLEAETISTGVALGRVLVEDILAPQDIPPFANSSMDGYAVHAADVATASTSSPVMLPVAFDIPAGSGLPQPLPKGVVARIMTGAPLPQSADAVVPIEMTDDSRQHVGLAPPAVVKIFGVVEEGAYVRLAGQDMRMGAKVLSASDFLRPQEVGVLAAVGRGKVRVVRQPRVAILSTGDELLGIDETLEPGKIRDANSYILASLVHRYGGIPLGLGIARDETQDVEAHLDAAIDLHADLILSSGGVSVGAFDCVKEVVQSHGEVTFWRVNMRPGKPVAFGHYKDIPFLGVPGNPVSAMASFEVFARPAIQKMGGRRNLEKPSVPVTIVEELTSDGRESYLRVVVRREGDRYLAHSTGSQDSGLLTSLVRANALLIVPAGVKKVVPGTQLTAWMLDWMEDQYT